MQCAKEQHWIKALLSNPNVQYTLGGLRELPIDTVERLIMTSLFRPSANVANFALQFSFQQNQPYVAIHARTGIDYGEWGNNQMQSMRKDMKSTALKLLKCAEETHYSGRKRIFLASDSQEFKNIFRNLSRMKGISIHTANIRTVHLDLMSSVQDLNTESKKCSSFLLVFSDMMLLAKAEAIISTGSGFSNSAFYSGDAIGLKVVNISEPDFQCHLLRRNRQ